MYPNSNLNILMEPLYLNYIQNTDPLHTIKTDTEKQLSLHMAKCILVQVVF